MPCADLHATFNPPDAYLTINDILPFVDLTSLADGCREDDIADLCKQAVAHEAPAFAVCVWPAYVTMASHLLKNTGVRVTTVLNYPKGNDPQQNILEDIQQSIQMGADEIDLVFPRDAFFSGDITGVAQLLSACRKACTDKTLKIILETGAFSDSATLADACRMCCDADADFLKTSTGKNFSGATPEAATTLLNVIKSYAPHTGIKLSGGIRTLKDARFYLLLVSNIMGSAWITPKHFRIGTSQLSA